MVVQEHQMVLYHGDLLMTDQVVEQDLRMAFLHAADIPMVADHGHQIEAMQLTQVCGVRMEQPDLVPVQETFPVR